MRYILFHFEWYYPCGGADDIEYTFDSEEELMSAKNLGRDKCSTEYYDCRTSQIYDTKKCEIIWRYCNNGGDITETEGSDEGL